MCLDELEKDVSELKTCIVEKRVPEPWSNMNEAIAAVFERAHVRTPLLIVPFTKMAVEKTIQERYTDVMNLVRRQA
jgi:hypothetical protein